MVNHTTRLETVTVGPANNQYEVWLQVTLLGGTVKSILGVRVLTNFTLRVEWERKKEGSGKHKVEKPGCTNTASGPGLFFLLGLESWLRKVLPRGILLDGLGNYIQEWLEDIWSKHIQRIS